MGITTLGVMMIGITLLLCLSDGFEVITLHVRHLLDISPVNLAFFFCPFFSSCFAPILVCVIIIIIIMSPDMHDSTKTLD